MRYYLVTSGSMEPVIPVGACVLVFPVRFSDLSGGMIITYRRAMDSSVITHRICEVDEETEQVWTKGDANEVPDGAPVAMGQIIGKVVLSLPGAGFWFYAAGSVWGKLSLVSLGMLLAVLPDRKPQTNAVRKDKK